MGGCSCGYTVAKLQAAAQAREAGLSCPQALLEAYREELGEKLPAVEALAGRLPELLDEPELCDVFAVTFAIIAQLTGIEDGYREAVARTRREYGGNGCGSGGEETALCTMRMKDCVLMIQWARGRQDRPEPGGPQ